MIPHPSAPLIAPLRELERRVLESSSAIEHWLRLQWQDHTPPFYASVDLRNSGFKLAPVDTNLFPGGFNNLNPQFVPLAVQASMVAIERICPDARNLLLIPENHTRNPYYLQNVGCLRTILRQAGLNVRIGTLISDIATPTEVPVTGGPALDLEALVRQGGRLGLADFDPCTILLNNDLSAGGFYRVHTTRGKDENLNAPGMRFEPLAFDNCCIQPDHFANPDATPNRFYSYGVVARLALLAAAIELEETAPQE